MGSMDSTGHGYQHSHQRQCGYIAVIHEGKLPKISSSDPWHSGSKLLLRMESINELRQKKYSAEGTNDGHCISRRI